MSDNPLDFLNESPQQTSTPPAKDEITDVMDFLGGLEQGEKLPKPSRVPAEPSKFGWLVCEGEDIPATATYESELGVALNVETLFRIVHEMLADDGYEWYEPEIVKCKDHINAYHWRNNDYHAYEVELWA